MKSDIIFFSDAIQTVAKATLESQHFAPCMVGSLESEFLKFLTIVSKAKTVLDVGTFTGNYQHIWSKIY